MSCALAGKYIDERECGKRVIRVRIIVQARRERPRVSQTVERQQLRDHNNIDPPVRDETGNVCEITPRGSPVGRSSL
jgi:hypothetical protein